MSSVGSGRQYVLRLEFEVYGDAGYEIHRTGSISRNLHGDSASQHVVYGYLYWGFPLVVRYRETGAQLQSQRDCFTGCWIMDGCGKLVI